MQRRFRAGALHCAVWHGAPACMMCGIKRQHMYICAVLVHTCTCAYQPRRGQRSVHAPQPCLLPAGAGQRAGNSLAALCQRDHAYGGHAGTQLLLHVWLEDLAARVSLCACTWRPACKVSVHGSPHRATDQCLKALLRRGQQQAVGRAAATSTSTAAAGR